MEKAGDFFECYGKMGATVRHDVPGLGMSDSEFKAWLTEAASLLVRNHALGDLMGYWNQMMSAGHDDSSPWP